MTAWRPWQYRTFEEAYRDLAYALTWEADAAPSPRGMPVRECLATQFTVTDPRARLLGSPARAANYGFAAGEFLWYLRGASDVASLAYYNKRTTQFSDDGTTMAGAYGPRVFGAAGIDLGPRARPDPDGRRGLSRSQWEIARDELLRDCDSRRALLSIYDAADAARAERGTRDVPCTVAIQFLLRTSAGGPRKLHAVVTMRSCDLVWGLTYDVFSFTLLQELMLAELREAGVDAGLGYYTHQAGSLHVYERHFETVAAVAAERSEPAGPMPPLGYTSDLAALLEDEVALREGRAAPEPRYGGAAAWLRLRLEEHGARRAAEYR
jgi:thymidylate synthase